MNALERYRRQDVLYVGVVLTSPFTGVEIVTLVGGYAQVCNELERHCRGRCLPYSVLSVEPRSDSVYLPFASGGYPFGIVLRLYNEQPD